MVHNQQILIWSMIIVVFCLIISKCHSYPTYSAYNDPSISDRPNKFQMSRDADRYINRMKQYYETMAHLRYWKRNLDESNENYKNKLQELLEEYDNLDYKR